mmetsp:Transcript_49533/g.133033  ORF Transcript_49533/g.133033 Transcript_49533/m.133033 type:complete len:92 (+) Transcript_49533:156-431(+)
MSKKLQIRRLGRVGHLGGCRGTSATSLTSWLERQPVTGGQFLKQAPPGPLDSLGALNVQQQERGGRNKMSDETALGKIEENKTPPSDAKKT